MQKKKFQRPSLIYTIKMKRHVVDNNRASHKKHVRIHTRNDEFDHQETHEDEDELMNDNNNRYGGEAEEKKSHQRFTDVFETVDLYQSLIGTLSQDETSHVGQLNHLFNKRTKQEEFQQAQKVVKEDRKVSVAVITTSKVRRCACIV